MESNTKLVIFLLARVLVICGFLCLSYYHGINAGLKSLDFDDSIDIKVYIKLNDEYLQKMSAVSVGIYTGYVLFLMGSIIGRVELLFKI